MDGIEHKPDMTSFLSLELKYLVLDSVKGRSCFRYVWRILEGYQKSFESINLLDVYVKYCIVVVNKYDDDELRVMVICQIMLDPSTQNNPCRIAYR